MLRLGSCFTGIGAWEKALKRLGVNYDLQWYFEKDKYASASYSAIHNESEDKNLWDITKVDLSKINEVDLLTYSPPCQAFSVAGRQEGTKDPRGVMFYHTLPIIEKSNPKVLMMENVKGLKGKKFKVLFEDMLKSLNRLGYNNYYEVLNSKDFGVPQNRERLFLISIRKDIDDYNFKFPKSFELTKKLKDVLDNNVESKYYINKCLNMKFGNNYIQYDNSGKGHNSQAARLHYWDNIMGTLPSSNNGDKTQIITCSKNDIVKYERTPLKFLNRNGKKTDGNYAYCVDTCNTGGVKEIHNDEIRVRKLTPLECWRLQDFDDDDYWKARKKLEETFYKGKDRSNSQMYKQAGNSITVAVPYNIMKGVIKYVMD